MIFVGVSCSNDNEQKNTSTEVFKREAGELAVPVVKDGDVKFYIYFESSKTKPLEFKNPKYYEDAAMGRPVSLPYWECAPMVWTNGVETYYANIVPAGTTNSYMILDHFAQTVYFITVHWGGSCSGK